MKSKGLALLGRANLNKRSSKTSVLPNIYIIYGLDTMQPGTKGLAGKTVRSFPRFLFYIHVSGVYVNGCTSCDRPALVTT